ncbi:MAG TPA: bifunctional UDP-N-acetylglucosamine diphosphorylase/glucosamine-1-phosphate N-acetyltransferase GlmU [Devosiaceae bacterium]|nr:bifunctional UDP-N-acetylglucosamine diphosphorylase/glucosamine-1-phosphate N-acetyltransferase GlmU [Devosiaceae bacterium]
MSDLTAIILAAGEGTRMKSARPKVLHEIGGRPIIAHVVAAVRDAGATTVAVVVDANSEAVRNAVRAVAPDALFAEQAEQRGTGDAARAARAAWEPAEGNVVVVYGDHPLLTGYNIRAVTEKLDARVDAAILGFEAPDPTGYGRLVVEGERLLAIREHADASEEEREIALCNASALAFRAGVFRDLIEKLSSDNAQKEYYVTDLVELANRAGLNVGYALAHADEVVGVNDRAQLAHAEGLFQRRMRNHAMAEGATLIDPRSAFFSFDTRLARDVTVEPGVVFGPGVTIGEGATIRAHSVLEGATVGPRAVIGPHARLRPGAEIGEGAKVGNFVEVKNAVIGLGAKVNHLSYIGDADIGANANIGAGTITCNYDGFGKYRTVIGEGAFIGSNTALVAPVTVGAGAYVASGSVVTENVDNDDLAIARGRQVNKPGGAKKLRQRLAAARGKA